MYGNFFQQFCAYRNKKVTVYQVKYLPNNQE